MNDKGDAADRLRQARLRRGYATAKDACVAFGWNYATYSQHERGERGIKNEVERYAAAYRVAVGWLLTGEGSIEGVPRAIDVPLISWVSAGNLETPFAVEDLASAQRVSIGDLPDGNWIALEVSGDSMDRISPPNSIIAVNRAERRLVANACYVFALDDGSASYKRFRPSPDRFEPVSSNPAHETIFPDGPVRIIGRVRRSILSM
jgi:phage repressor protein C with HTH and peptisase S24 domain